MKWSCRGGDRSPGSGRSRALVLASALIRKGDRHRGLTPSRRSTSPPRTRRSVSLRLREMICVVAQSRHHRHRRNSSDAWTDAETYQSPTADLVSPVTTGDRLSTKPRHREAFESTSRWLEIAGDHSGHCAEPVPVDRSQTRRRFRNGVHDGGAGLRRAPPHRRVRDRQNALPVVRSRHPFESLQASRRPTGRTGCRKFTVDLNIASSSILSTGFLCIVAEPSQ